MLINGEQGHHLTAFDRGLSYGDGFFETFYCAEGMLQNWSYHWRRIQRSADILRIRVPDESRFLLDFEHLKEKEPSLGRESVVKMILTRGLGSRGYSAKNCHSPTRILYHAPMPDYRQLRATGMEANLLAFRLNPEGRLAGLKHLNRLQQVLAKMELDETGGDEGLVCNAEGYVREGVSSNLFMVRGNYIFTPPLRDCGVEGVLRNKLIDLAPKICNIKVVESNFLPEELVTADSLFFTNSLLGVCPVRKLGEKQYEVNEITQALMNSRLELGE